MNKNLNEAISGIEKADALMYAMENTYLDFNFDREELEKANRAVNAFYALWDILKGVAESLEKLEGDSKVVDVIHAINKAKNA